jgi:RNA polymerase sigma factor (TIGR02999 family)
MGDLNMAPKPEADVTQLLLNWGNGDQASLEELMPRVYGELRRLAGAYLRRERADHTLQSTALVHEAFIRLVQQRDVQWRNRAHFFGIAAQMIRRILVDHARSKRADKRGSGGIKLELNEAMAVSQDNQIDIVELDSALEKLALLDPRQSRIVELRFFAGLSVEETAEVTGLSPATVKREWSTAKAWLFREMS